MPLFITVFNEGLSLSARAEGTNEKKCIRDEPKTEFHLGSDSSEEARRKTTGRPTDKNSNEGFQQDHPPT